MIKLIGVKKFNDKEVNEITIPPNMHEIDVLFIKFINFNFFVKK